MLINWALFILEMKVNITTFFNTFAIPVSRVYVVCLCVCVYIIYNKVFPIFSKD